MNVDLRLGDCLEVLREMPDCSVDAVVTDPPYDLTSIQERFGKPGSAPAQFGIDGAFARHSRGFMGMSWDGQGIAFRPDLWAEVFRVMKPGAHLLAFGGTRTYHRMACAIEDAGFEIRDSIHWVYGSGFPKSHDVSKDFDKRAGVTGQAIGKTRGKGYTSMQKTIVEQGYRPYTNGLPAEHADRTLHAPATPEAQQWQGWGTALKPAHEPIVLARKPLCGTVATNVEAWGVGAINIDAGRVGGASLGLQRPARQGKGITGGWASYTQEAGQYGTPDGQGRWPANVVLDPEAARLLDAQSGTLTSGTGAVKRASGNGYAPNAYGKESRPAGSPNVEYGDSGGASRFFATFDWEPGIDVPFFYCPKASRSERNQGLDDRKPQKVNDGRKTVIDNPYQRGETQRLNTHPTVKPVKLMRYLCRLITPPSGVILDPFMGSGTTGVAAVSEGYDFIGIEREAEYMEIAKRRIDHARGTVKQMELAV